MILHYSTEGSIHVSDNLEDVLSQIGMNACLLYTSPSPRDA